MKITDKLFLGVSLSLALPLTTLFASNIEQQLSSDTDAFLISQSNTELMRVDGNGSVGIGIDTPSSRLHVEHNHTTPGEGQILSKFKMLANPSADNNSYYYGSTMYAQTTEDSPHYIRGLVGGLASATRNGTGRTYVGQGFHGLFYMKGGVGNYLSALNGQFEASGGVAGYGTGTGGAAYLRAGSTVTNVKGVSGSVTTYGDASSTNITALSASINHTSSENVTNMKGLNLNLIGSGTATNAYGVYIAPVTHGSAKSYSIYSNGGTSYFKDQVAIGTETADSKLSVVGLPSGTTDAVTTGTLAGAVCITDAGNMYIDTDGVCGN